MIVAITGHRPNKLPRRYDEYVGAIGQQLEKMGAILVYEGQAAGADIMAAHACVKFEIPYIAVLPWAGHRASLPKIWQTGHELAERYAERVEVLSDAEEYPGPWVYHNRNQFMVDHADAVLAVYDGSPGGGTASTAKYAQKRNKPVYRLDPQTLRVSPLG